MNKINADLSTAEITDKEAANKILALVPQEWIKKIPFFVRKNATMKTIERIANQHSDLYAVAKKPGELPENERKELLAANFSNTKTPEIGKILPGIPGLLLFERSISLQKKLFFPHVQKISGENRPYICKEMCRAKRNHRRRIIVRYVKTVGEV